MAETSPCSDDGGITLALRRAGILRRATGGRVSAVAAMPGPRRERTLAARSRAWPCWTFLPDRVQLKTPSSKPPQNAPGIARGGPKTPFSARKGTQWGCPEAEKRRKSRPAPSRPVARGVARDIFQSPSAEPAHGLPERGLRRIRRGRRPDERRGVHHLRQRLKPRRLLVDYH